jgi:hypothetical protein
MPGNKTKPVIPEPSPRFFAWSLVAAVLFVVVVMAFRVWADGGFAERPAAKVYQPKDQHQGGYTLLQSRSASDSVLNIDGQRSQIS